MKPINQVDIWNLMQPFIGDIEPAYFTVTLNFDGDSTIHIAAHEPKSVSLTRTQTKRLWERLAGAMSLPVLGVKKVTFTIEGAGFKAPTFHIEMKPVSKPSRKTRMLRLSKVEGEEGEIAGEQVIEYVANELSVMAIKTSNAQMLQAVRDAVSRLPNGDKVVVIAVADMDDLDMFRFEEVEIH